MKNKIYFVFCVHCHQPVGNFEYIIENNFSSAYLPFIETLSLFPNIKICLHYSGYLLEYLQKNKKNFLKKIKKLVEKKQIEIMSGGFYEPILPLIPDDYKIKQIEKLNKYIKNIFAYSPSGFWLAERVWEGNLSKILFSCGIKYTFIDNTVFLNLGFSEENTLFPFITEEEGKKIILFPINQKIRHSIPFDIPEKSIEILFSNISDEQRVIVFADDGEKFGSWPGTNTWVYEEKWLYKFFNLLSKYKEIEMVLAKDLLEKDIPLKRIYIPPTSYSEMLKWSGGYFKNFFSKYEESNNMHKKMIYLCNKSKDKKIQNYIEDKIMRAQCNDAYWHGVFGGLYIDFLRQEVYKNLISAEKIIDSSIKNNIEVIDINCDGKEEILFSNRYINLYFIPHYGGSLFEFDYKTKPINFLATLSRYKEEYHKGIERDVYYDWYKKYSLIDHFLREDTDIFLFQKSKYGEQGDFVNQKYNYKIKNKNLLQLIRYGGVWCGDEFVPFCVGKEIFFENNGFTAKYKIKNLSDKKQNVWFGVEFNFTLSSSDVYCIQKNTQEKICEYLEYKDISSIKIINKYLKLGLHWKTDIPLSFFIFPIKTISRTEKEIIETQQGYTLLINKKFLFYPDGEVCFEIKNSILDISSKK